MVDLRDDRAVRFTYMNMLMDWGGNDLNKVYEPVSRQIGIVFFTIFVMVGCYLAWKMFKKWREERKQSFIPYKVIKPPSSVVEDETSGKKKRVCAILGGTGFIGSHVVDEFVRRGECRVYMLGRKFRPERTNPAADALIQVDMQDFDGLVNAFQGVDSVIDVAAAVPTVFTSVDDIWRINKQGLENVVKAAQTAGVKSLVFICTVPVKGKPRDEYIRAFINSFSWGEKYILEMNGEGEERLHTCVICPGTIVGLRSDFIEPLVSGKMKFIPMRGGHFTFLPVEHLANAITNAEQKLASGCEDIAGKSLPIAGEAMSFKQFLSLPTWPHKFSSMPLWALKFLTYLNLFCATLTGYAPFGAELCPSVVAFFALEEEEVDSTTTFKLLELDPPAPIEEYVAELVKRYNARV